MFLKKMKIFHKNKNVIMWFYQGGKGHWTVNEIGTHSFLTTLSYPLAQKTNIEI